ncbi:MAG: N-acetyltransferase [Pseudomonadota bacterium]
MIEILPETPALHADAIEALYDRTFGPGHFAKTAERLREGNASVPDVTRVAVSDGAVIGVCRVWPILVGTGSVSALFIGPVAVDPTFQGQRLGLTVTGEALEAATKAGWDAAVIIGAPGYFGELGFEQVAPDRLVFPGPQDMARVMVRDLAGSAAALSGMVRVG